MVTTPERRPLVLIVDDDDAVRQLERRTLVPAGYDVVEATSGAHALALINGGLHPDLVVTDLDMPGIPGELLVQRLRAARPHQRVLYVTGKIHRVLAIPPDMRAGDLFLDKPFTTKGLLDAVAQTLAAEDAVVAPPPGIDASAAAPSSAAALKSAVPTRVLVVDDGDTHSAFVRFALPGAQFAISIAEENEAERLTRVDKPDVVVVSARRLRPALQELVRHLKGATTPAAPVLLITGDSDRRERMRALEAGADDFLAEPLDAVELLARVRTLSTVKRLTDELDTFERALVNVALAVEARDPSTHGHCERLAKYALMLGERMQLGRADLAALHCGAFLHDIGKIAIPDAILLKPGALTRAEFATMQTHPVAGERLCADVPSLARVRPIIRHHHERFDGSGYPDGLQGDDIPLLAEIIGLVDIYDALTTSRSYQKAMSFDQAAAVLEEQARRAWRRPELVQTLLTLLTSRSRPIGLASR